MVKKYNLVYKFKNKEYKCVDRFIIEPVHRLIAIGDIHGDLDLLLDSLKIAKLIEQVNREDKYTVSLIYKDGRPRYYRWTGKDTYVVQVGDQVDRCRPFIDDTGMKKTCEDADATYLDEASDEKILVFLSDLDKVARKFKGAVFSLLGNHELMNTIGNMNYVSYMGIQEYNDVSGRVNYFRRGSDMSKFIACTRPSVLIVGSYMFVHAGFINDLIDHKKDKNTVLSQLNILYDNWLSNKIKQLDKEKNKLIYGTTLSPLWVRGLGSIPAGLGKEYPMCENFNTVLDYFSIKGMVIGHTPQMKHGINATCGNSLIRVDVASSRAFHNIFKYQTVDEEEAKLIENGRRAQVLEIIDDKEIYILTEDSRTKLI